MMRQRSHALALLAVFLLLLTAGCYTVLQHPTGSHVATDGAYYRSCADCHADAAYYHPYSHQHYRYGRSQYGWGDYYGSPWWYNDYWWWDDHHDHGDYDHEGPEIETGTRHLWSSDGWASGGWGFVRPGSGSGAGGDRPSQPESGKFRQEERKPEKTKKKDKDKKDEEKKEEKDTRDLWKKPKKGF